MRSPQAIVRLVERIVDPLAVRLQGDHLLRDPADHLGPLGLTVERAERAKLGILEWVVARKATSHLYEGRGLFRQRKPLQLRTG
ncbi:MAG: hypothetical protein LC797_06765 [Chloroflexi bacterium]|nr:hypothetical protein [Chloroflexota bacterium]